MNARSLFVLLIALPSLPAIAQIPNTLLHSVPPLAVAQSGASLGHSVAMDGAYTVVGAPYDDIGAPDSGVVKVFDSTTGVLLFILANPSPATGDYFGFSVAIAGARIVVGAYLDNTGATDAGSAYVYDLSSGTPTVPVATLNNPAPAVSDYFGFSVAISGTRVIIGAVEDDTGATSAGSAYVYDLGSGTPTVPVTTLNNPAPAVNDYFGTSVAITGTRLVIGADQDDTGADAAGSAYVYDLSSGTPTVPVQTLNNPSPAAGDFFGNSVAISGTRVVVGARLDDAGATDAGSAYVYDMASGTATVPVAILNNPSPAASDYFGNLVTISGTQVVVAARYDDTGATNAGVVYLYDLSSGTPALPVTTLNNPSTAANDYFGWSVAVSGTRIVVGTPLDDTGGINAGSAYIFDLSSGTPTVPVATLNNPGLAFHGYFGASVAVSGTRMVVGAWGGDTGGSYSGSAYVYDLASGTPTVPAVTLNNPSPAANDRFGWAVAISGTRVVVGATQDDTGATDAGSAYVYDMSSGTPAVPVLVLNNPGPAAGDIFGYSVAISGTRVVVAALSDDTGATDTGSAYAYDLSSGTPTVPMATLNNPSPAASDQFGRCVAISGTRVVVGTIQDDTGATDTGSAYVYDLTSGTPTAPVTTLNNPSPAAFDYFGYAVAISGNRVVVGVHGDDTGATNSGCAYIYDLGNGTPTVPAVTLINPSPATQDFFGWTVAISGTRVVVGAYLDDTGATDAGSVYAYDLSRIIPVIPTVTLNNPGPPAGDGFGLSVSIDGTTVAVGAPYDDSTTTDNGYTYVFGPHPLDQDSDGLLDSWELSYWPTLTGHSALDDWDKDGYNELLELALGLNPTLASAGGLPAATTEGGYLTMTINKQAGVTYEVQSAGSLLPAQPDSFSASTTTVLANNATTLKVRDNTLVGTPLARFMRVKLTAAP